MSAIALLAVAEQNTATVNLMDRLNMLAATHPDFTSDMLATYVESADESDKEMKAKWSTGPLVSDFIHVGLIPTDDEAGPSETQIVGPLAFLNLAVQAIQPGATVFSTWRLRKSIPDLMDPLKDAGGYYYFTVDEGMNLENLMADEEFLGMFEIPKDMQLIPYDSEEDETILDLQLPLVDHMRVSVRMGPEGEHYANVHCRLQSVLEQEEAREAKLSEDPCYGPRKYFGGFTDYRVEEGTTVEALLANEEFRARFDITEATSVSVNGVDTTTGSLATGDNLELYASSADDSAQLALLKIVALPKEELQAWVSRRSSTDETPMDYRLEEGINAETLFASETFRTRFDITEDCGALLWVNEKNPTTPEWAEDLKTGDKLELRKGETQVALLNVITMSKEELDQWESTNLDSGEDEDEYVFNGFVIGTINFGDKHAGEIMAEAKTAPMVAVAF